MRVRISCSLGVSEIPSKETMVSDGARSGCGPGNQTRSPAQIRFNAVVRRTVCSAVDVSPTTSAPPAFSRTFLMPAHTSGHGCAISTLGLTGFLGSQHADSDPCTRLRQQTIHTIHNGGGQPAQAALKSVAASGFAVGGAGIYFCARSQNQRGCGLSFRDMMASAGGAMVGKVAAPRGSVG